MQRPPPRAPLRLNRSTQTLSPFSNGQDFLGARGQGIPQRGGSGLRPGGAMGQQDRFDRQLQPRVRPMLQQQNDMAQRSRTSNQVRSSYDMAGNMGGYASRTRAGGVLNQQQFSEGGLAPRQRFERNPLGPGAPGGLRPNEKQFPGGDFNGLFREATLLSHSGPEWADIANPAPPPPAPWQTDVIDDDAPQGPFESGGSRDSAAGSSMGRSSAGLTASSMATSSSGLEADEEEPQDYGHAVNESAGRVAGDEDYAGAVYNENGERVDPVTGLPINWVSSGSGGGGGWQTDYDPSTPGVSPYPDMISMDGMSSGDREWAEWLQERGYYVVQGTDENGNPGWQIRGGTGGYGDSGTWQGLFNDPSDWTDGMKALRRKYEEENAGRLQARAAEERRRKFQENMSLMPNAPQVGDSERDAMIEAQRQLGALEHARNMRGVMSGASRARMGINASAGLAADSGNRFAAQQQAQAADLMFRVKMQNFEALKNQYSAQVNLLQQFIQSETDAANREAAQAQLKEILKYKAEIELEMMREQQRAQQGSIWERAAKAGLKLAGQAGGAIIGGPAGGAVGGTTGDMLGGVLFG